MPNGQKNQWKSNADDDMQITGKDLAFESVWEASKLKVSLIFTSS